MQKKHKNIKSVLSILLLFLVIPVYAFLSYIVVYGFLLPTEEVLVTEAGVEFETEDLQELDTFCKENGFYYWVFKDKQAAWFTWWQQDRAYYALRDADWTQGGKRGQLVYSSKFTLPHFYLLRFDQIPYFFKRRP